jgi:hypothetical protein
MSATILESLTVNQVGNSIRLVVGIAVALMVTAGLFWMMQAPATETQEAAAT